MSCGGARLLRAIMRSNVHYLMDDEAMICSQSLVATQIGVALAGAASLQRKR